MTRTITLALATALVGSAAFAQSSGMDTGTLMRSGDITGADVYTTNTDMDDTSWDSLDITTMDDTWNEIGEIEDLVLDQNGQMVGVIAEIGGFLDIGDKHVMIETSDFKLSREDDDDGDDDDYVLVVRQTEEQLEAMPEADDSLVD